VPESYTYKFLLDEEDVSEKQCAKRAGEINATKT
jgi:hypothetical protein